MVEKVIFVPHCILNPLVKEGSMLAKDMIRLFAESEIGIVQLPCPEIEYNGKLVKGLRYNKKYREHCKKLSIKIMKDIKNYREANYKVLGILGIELSNTCGVHKIQRGKREVHGRGVFMKEIENEMRKRNFQVPIISANFHNMFSTLEKMSLLIKNS